MSVVGGQPPFERSPVTTALIALFRGTAPGEVVSDSEISDAAGCASDGWMHLMTTVRKELCRHGINLSRVRGEGYIHTDDHSTREEALRAVPAAHRKLRRGVRQFDEAVKDPTTISPTHIQRVSGMRVVAHLTSPKAQRAIAAGKAVINGKVDAGIALALKKP